MVKYFWGFLAIATAFVTLHIRKGAQFDQSHTGFEETLAGENGFVHGSLYLTDPTHYLYQIKFVNVKAPIVLDDFKTDIVLVENGTEQSLPVSSLVGRSLVEGANQHTVKVFNELPEGAKKISTCVHEDCGSYWYVYDMLEPKESGEYKINTFIKYSDAAGTHVINRGLTVPVKIAVGFGRVERGNITLLMIPLFLFLAGMVGIFWILSKFKPKTV
ncbi:MAG: hypothetical protein JST80_08395 [Bdellovibrionales bacterium]|nr:hypothetical protein [Bdellovibrionales bacterium]